MHVSLTPVFLYAPIRDAGQSKGLAMLGNGVSFAMGNAENSGASAKLRLRFRAVSSLKELTATFPNLSAQCADSHVRVVLTLYMAIIEGISWGSW